MRAEDALCPNCGAQALRIELRPTMRAKQTGTYSIAGATPKVVAEEVDWPWLVCVECGVEAAAK